MSEEATQEVKETPNVVSLTEDEKSAVVEPLKRLAELQKEFAQINNLIAPFVQMIAKSHGIDSAAYALTPDGSAFVKRQ
jgi:hypothetical protein